MVRPIWHWLVSLGGLCVAASGVAVMAYLRLGRWGGLLVGVGFVMFVLGIPSEAQRKGYREWTPRREHRFYGVHTADNRGIHPQRPC